MSDIADVIDAATAYGIFRSASETDHEFRARVALKVTRVIGREVMEFESWLERFVRNRRSAV